MAALLVLVADLADLLQVAVRVGDENPCALAAVFVAKRAQPRKDLFLGVASSGLLCHEF